MKNQSGKPYLTTRSLQPENQETPIQFLNGDPTPIELFYIRNHFSYPQINGKNLFLNVSGNVSQPIRFHLYDLMQLPLKSVSAYMECAGNQRAKFQPKVYGEQWEKGAISQGLWEGTSLKDILMLVGIDSNAKEVVFEGWDQGVDSSKGITSSFRRSLPLYKALHEDTIIAFKYNNKPLIRQHGAPFRLIVPQWYGMASVKWLKSITLLTEKFIGPYQTEDYVYYPHKDKKDDAFPVTTVNVNSIIQQPLNMSTLKTGYHNIIGLAWTGTGRINKVQLSFDNGVKWYDTVIKNLSNYENYKWMEWKYLWNVDHVGEYNILCRAMDTAGNYQPLKAFWNQKGYGYNACDEIRVKIVP